MKSFIPGILALLLVAFAASAAISVPGADGSDGALNITVDTEIDLSQAVDGTWDDENSANAGQGVYDAEKWAVIFKYSSVYVATDATITFKNHPSRAPVVWLVDGNVTIDGTVSLDGEDWVRPPLLSQPGPGGFRGGLGLYAAANMGAGGGLGPEGGPPGRYGGRGGGRGLDSPTAVPLVGGCGGGG